MRKVTIREFKKRENKIKIKNTPENIKFLNGKICWFDDYKLIRYPYLFVNHKGYLDGGYFELVDDFTLCELIIPNRKSVGE